MSQQNLKVVTVRSDIVQHQLDCIFQELHALQMNVPILDKNPKFIKEQSDGKILESLSTVVGVSNLLRILKKRPKKAKQYKPEANEEDDVDKLPNIIFCRPVREVSKDQKIFWLLRNHQKKKLDLDRPKAVLVLPRAHLLTVQRKYINLYQIQDNLTLNLKHFNSAGIGKRMTLVDLKYINFNKKDYVIVFGNQKQNYKFFFLALVYEIVNNKLRFVKKSTICNQEILSPIIFFEEYITRKGITKFCLVLGGKDSSGSNFYDALQINLHIFLNQFLTYDAGSTMVIPFTNKVPLFNGKIIKYDHKWYAFCSEEQTINQVSLQYQGCGILAHVQIKNEKLEFNEKFFFSEDSVKALYDGDQQKIIFIDKHLNLTYKSFHKIIMPFNN